MASIEKIKEFSTLGREIGFTGSELNSFVSSRCEEYERERKHLKPVTSYTSQLRQHTFFLGENLRREMRAPAASKLIVLVERSSISIPISH